MIFKYIQKTPLFNIFSDIGKRIYLPQGIFHWSKRAENEAELIGTIGSAYSYEKDFIINGSEKWVPCYIKEFKEYTKISVNSLVPYAPIGGISELRGIWKKWIIKKSNYNEISDVNKINFLEKYTSMPIITQGITNGIFVCCSLFLNPNDYVILPNKRWENYDNIINNFIGAKIKSFEFFDGKNFNIKSLKEVILEVAKKQKKIIIILNFPNNPTGYCPTKEEGELIVQILEECHKITKLPFVILFDDAYEPFIYNKNSINRSLFYDILELKQDIIPIKLDGISKELLAYGGRVAFITLGMNPKWVKNNDAFNFLKMEINNKLEGILRSTISNVNHFYQAVTLVMFEEKGMNKILKSREKIYLLLKDRYEVINFELTKIKDPNISVDPNSGGFFVFVNLNPKKFKATAFADYLLNKHKVGIIPVENFDENVNGIRIAYCSIDIEKIPELINRINLALNDY